MDERRSGYARYLEGRAEVTGRSGGVEPTKADEEEIDRLFELPPDEFVAARNDLVRRLREAGREGPASAVKALRRPTATAWALNQAVRRRPRDVTALLDSVDEIRRQQGRAAGGAGPEELRAAMSRRRSVVASLADAAQEALRSSGRGDQHRAAIEETLEAASLTEEGGQILRRGRLSGELSAATGFEALAGASVEADAKRSRKGTGNLASTRAAAATEARALADQARRARREADRAKAAAERERERAERLARSAAEAAGDAEAAEARAGRAAQDAAAAERAARKAEERLDARRARSRAGD